MTKEDLAKKKGSEVRHDAILFPLFEKFIVEDFGFMPSGCFGCDFNKHFSDWAKPYLQEEKKELILKKYTMKNYILKDENYKTFHNGEVLSKNSSSEDWADFINENENQIVKRKALFTQLPASISNETEKANEAEVIGKILEKKTENLKNPVAAKTLRKNGRKK